jgi:hypothetical protein
MNSTSLDRFNKRKKLKNTITVYDDVDENLVNQFLNSKMDNEKVDNFFKSTSEFYSINVSDEEAKEFLEQFKKDFNQERFDKLIVDCRKEVINSIVTPFGLGKIIAAYDKVGGNVNTVHNVRGGVYATEAEQKAYENRGEYNSDDYHKDQNYININKEYSESRKDGNAVDYMTGEKLNPNESHDLDHIVSAKENHDDAGRVLAEIDGKVLANTATNLRPTTATNNRSKKADDMHTFLAKKNERVKKIDELKSKGNLSPQEQNELKKLEELVKIDDKIALEADKKAREEIDKKINKAYYTSGKFAKDTTIASMNEGGKMGIQQAMGLVMTEFFTALFDEVLDIYKNGFSNGFEGDGFFKILKERLKNIAQKLQAKWKDVVIAFKDGFFSGFISNLVTTAINMLETTGKRVIRIIREGIYSLFKAVKILLFPPENLTYTEAFIKPSIYSSIITPKLIINPVTIIFLASCNASV